MGNYRQSAANGRSVAEGLTMAVKHRQQLGGGGSAEENGTMGAVFMRTSWVV